MAQFISKSLPEYCSGFILVFATNIAFIPQYLQIENTGKTGFSKYVCLVFIVSNILRLFFRVGKVFSIYLVLQSVITIFTQLAILEAIVSKNKNKATIIRDKSKSFIVKFLSSFWEWDDFLHYVFFIAAFNGLMALFTYLSRNLSLYFEVIGFFALCLDCTMGIPQIIKNFKYRSTNGLSTSLIIFWVLSDICKAFYYTTIEVPSQFNAAVSIQILMDLVLLFQCFFYGKNFVLTL